MVHGRAGGGGAAGVGALVRGLLEEVVLQGVEGRNARLGVVVQHAQDQVLELQVVARGVTLLPGPPPARTPSLHPQNLVESPCSRGLVLLMEEGRRDGEVDRGQREIEKDISTPVFLSPQSHTTQSRGGIRRDKDI